MYFNFFFFLQATSFVSVMNVNIPVLSSVTFLMFLPLRLYLMLVLFLPYYFFTFLFLYFHFLFRLFSASLTRPLLALLLYLQSLFRRHLDFILFFFYLTYFFCLKLTLLLLHLHLTLQITLKNQVGKL